MRVLAAYIMKGRLQAMVVAAGFALLTFLLMPLSWPVSFLSGAAVALVTLMQGPREGLLNALGATLILAVMTTLLMGSPVWGMAYTTTVWLPAWLLAFVLQQSVSLATALLVNAALGLVVIIAAYVLLGDPASWWYSYFTQQVLPIMEQAGVELLDQPGFDTSLKQASQIMTGFTAATLGLGMTLTLLIARWWQSQLVRPGGFREEFQQLRLGKAASVVMLLFIMAALLSSGTVSEATVNAAMVMAVLFMFQGLAVGHSLVAILGGSTAWLVAMYVFMLFTFPYGVMFATLIGLVDNWFNFRNRFRGRAV